MSKKAFIVGPGFVGREIIDLLRAEGKYAITTLVRREAAAAEFQKDGLTTVMGDLDDFEKIKNLAKESDLVFHTATSDHIPSAQALLDGIKERAAEGKHTIYLHQSGASVISDHSAGDVGDAKVWSDLTPTEIDQLPESAPHRATDLAILKIRRELGDKAKIFIVIPPIIYGTNPKYNRLSIQIPHLTRFAFKHGHVGVVGAGKGTWGAIHVLDLAKAYITILHWLEQNPAASDLSNPYFFAESQFITWGEVSNAIAKGLHSVGRITDPVPKAVPKEQWGDLYGDFTPDALACNAKGRADRLRTLGWKPVQRNVAEAFVDEDMPVLLMEA